MQGPLTQPQPAIGAGTVLAGKYRVERQIGQGGMGTVVVARHLELDELVAIKFLRPETVSNPEAVLRFAQEARASAKIQSEHVARTLDVGKLENGAPYMVMEYLRGTDLGARLCQSGPLPIEEAVDFTLQACHALADAHAIGIIHRDIKPSNLFVMRKTDGKESIKVLDFGISKITGKAKPCSSMGVTHTQSLMGSPFYMSPEEMASPRNVGPSTDIWALGVTFYELVTGRLPFDGDSITELCSRVLTQPVPSLTAWLAQVPDGLQAVVERCLEKDPAKRYANVAELAAALMPYGTKRGRLTAMAVRRVLQMAGQTLSPDMLTLASNLPSVSADVLTSDRVTASLAEIQPESKRRVALLIGLFGAALLLGAVTATVIMKTLNRQTVAALPQLPITVISTSNAETPIGLGVVRTPTPAVSAMHASMQMEPSPDVPASAVTPQIVPLPVGSAPTAPIAGTPLATDSKLLASKFGKHSKTSRSDTIERLDGAPATLPSGVSAPAKPSPGTERKRAVVTDFGGRLF
jgi:serine/threonine protein kinase